MQPCALAESFSDYVDDRLLNLDAGAVLIDAATLQSDAAIEGAASLPAKQPCTRSLHRSSRQRQTSYLRLHAGDLFQNGVATSGHRAGRTCAGRSSPFAGQV